jgi:hypothetical protein
MFPQRDVLKLSDLIKNGIVQQLSLILFDLNSKLSGLMVYESSVWTVMQIIHQLSRRYVQ